MDSLYKMNRPISALQGYYRHPRGGFVHGREHLVATIRGEGDGRTVKVYETRLPARFFCVRVMAGKNSVGARRAGYTVWTGSGMGELVGQMAVDISRGMIEFRRLR